MSDDNKHDSEYMRQQVEGIESAACVVCGTIHSRWVVNANKLSDFCSTECYSKNYSKKPGFRLKLKNYNALPESKARRIAYDKSPRGKAKRKIISANYRSRNKTS